MTAIPKYAVTLHLYFLFIHIFIFILFLFIYFPHFSRNYVAIVPTQFSFGKDLEIFVQMLNPVSYESVQAKLEDKDNKTIATGSLTLNSGEYTFLIFPCICFCNT